MKTIFDPREYAKWWFRKSSLTPRMAATHTSLHESFFLDYKALLQQHSFKHKAKVQGLSKDELFFALKEYITVSLETERDEAIRGFLCENEDLEPLKAWIKAVTGAERPNDIAVIAHWLWMVKRKALRLPVKYHVMPVLLGDQGSGKSKALIGLISPLALFKMNMKMTQLTDERVYEGFSQNLIVVFDELQGIERTDLNALKNQITTDMNTYRKLHTHTMVNVPMNISFIGATNKHLNESFSDSTGMRRFWEMPTLKIIDWSVVNSMDYAELWKGIDEKNEEGYLAGEVLAAVLLAQESLVNADDIEVFIAENRLQATTNDYKALQLHEAYRMYQDWASASGIKSPLNAIWFSRKLGNRLDSFIERDSNGVKRRVFKVNPESTKGISSVTVVPLRKEVT